MDESKCDLSALDLLDAPDRWTATLDRTLQPDLDPESTLDLKGVRTRNPRPVRRIAVIAAALVMGLAATASLFVAFDRDAEQIAPVQAQQFGSAEQLMGTLRAAGIGCERFGIIPGLFPTNRDAGGCDVTGGSIAVYVYPSEQAMANDPAMRVPRRWAGVSWVVGPNWFVATGSPAAAETVHGVVGGVVLGGPAAQTTASAARYFFSASGITGVFEVSSSPPSICYSTATVGTLPISVVATATGEVAASFAPHVTNDFCDRGVGLYLTSDLIRNPAAYQVSWQPIDGGPTEVSSFGDATIPSEDPRRIGPVSEPCDVTGNLETLDAASASAGYQLLAPHDPSADSSSGDSMIGVWDCPGDEVEMSFASGITVLQEANSITDPAQAWQRLAQQDPADTSVGTVQGQPAALIDPAKSTGNALGSVTVVIDGTIVWVIGDGQIAIADLVRVADSLQAA